MLYILVVATVLAELHNLSDICFDKSMYKQPIKHFGSLCPDRCEATLLGTRKCWAVHHEASFPQGRHYGYLETSPHFDGHKSNEKMNVVSRTAS